MWHSISWFLYVLHYFLVVILYWLQAVQYCTAYTCNIAHISYVHILFAYVVCIFYLLFGVLATLGFLFFIFYLWAKKSYSISWSAWVYYSTMFGMMIIPIVAWCWLHIHDISYDIPMVSPQRWWTFLIYQRFMDSYHIIHFHVTHTYISRYIWIKKWLQKNNHFLVFNSFTHTHIYI